MQRLSPQQRAAVVLKDVFEMSLEETAELLGTTIGSVKAALHRGRARLRDPAASAPSLHWAVTGNRGPLRTPAQRLGSLRAARTDERHRLGRDAPLPGRDGSGSIRTQGQLVLARWSTSIRSYLQRFDPRSSSTSGATSRARPSCSASRWGLEESCSRPLPDSRSEMAVCAGARVQFLSRNGA